VTESRDGYNVAFQLERTVLAWNRSSLAIATNGALVVREGVVRHLPLVTGAGLAISCVAGVLWLLSTGRYHGARDRRATRLVAERRRSVLLLASFAAVLSLADLALVATA
jgi:uncharacterized membrane protein YidH (DUF202 family)